MTDENKVQEAKNTKKMFAKVQIMTILAGAGKDICDVADSNLLTDEETDNLKVAADTLTSICNRMYRESVEVIKGQIEGEKKVINKDELDATLKDILSKL